MSSPQTRAELLGRLDQTLRKVGAHSVLLSDAVAGLVGINSTDLECLDLIDLAGGTTPGWLARRTGLTTGAMTAVVDRLERAGLVRRSRDPEDRRRVRLEALPGAVRRIGPLYERLATATARLNAEYDDRQLATVVDYLSRTLDLLAEHVAWLQTHGPSRHTRRVGGSTQPRAASPGRRRVSRRAASTSEAPAMPRRSGTAGR